MLTCSEVGWTLTAQSPYTSTLSGNSMKNTDETNFGVRNNCSAGRIVAAVVDTAPLTIPSASPIFTIIVPNILPSCI